MQNEQVKIFIKPAVAGSIVRHPEKLNYIIPETGEWVVDSNQWQRYIKHGDVVLATPPTETAANLTPEKQDKPTKGGDK